MSRRLGGAIADHIRRTCRPDSQSYIVIEGVPVAVADGISRAWDSSLPQLAIASSVPELFGAHALRNVSGTRLRNQSPNGVVVVLCEGEQIPDRQSQGLFESVSPSVLLESPEGMGILSRQEPAVDLDGPVRAVREAVVLCDGASRPSAIATATYFDRVAAGEDPLAALPAIGAFKDGALNGVRVDADRIGANLELAASRTRDDVLRPTAYADLRRRTENVLKRRPGLRAEERLRARIDEIMAMLEAGSGELLEALDFDEAREILEQKPQNLAAVVRQEILEYTQRLASGSQAESLPWHRYLAHADRLRRGAGQREAAEALCEVDDAQQRAIFSVPTRRKLERLLRDKTVSGSNPSCPEAAIVRAALQLGGMIDRVQVLAPFPPNAKAANNRTGAGRILTLACARFRLGGLFRRWETAGGEIDGLLLKAADDEDLGNVLDAFSDAGLDSGGQLPPLQLRLHRFDDATTVQVDWRPDLDDVAALRVALLFSKEPCITLTMSSSPSLQNFCGAEEATPVLGFPSSLLPLAQALARTARSLLDNGLEPAVLTEWTESWRAICARQDAAGTADDAEALTVAGAVVVDRVVALTALAPLKAEWLAQYLQALWQLVGRAEEPHTLVEPSDAVAAASGVAKSTAAHYPAHLRLSTQDRVLLPTVEGRTWGMYGGDSTWDGTGFSGDALRSVVTQLLALQPEAAGHLRCLAWGSGAADLLVRQAVRLIGTSVERATINKIEIFCIGTATDGRPSWETLAHADEELRGGREVLELRYVDSLADARRLLRPRSGAPAVHLALVTGLTKGGKLLQVESPEVEPPQLGEEVLFCPRVWQRPNRDRRTLLMPPTTTPAGLAWLRLQNAVEDTWPAAGEQLRIPEVRTGTLDVSAQLQEIHELALWVATLDRYATRDSLEQGLGKGNIAILHQERRLGGDSPVSLVLSQKSGGPADRAIGRSLRAAGIVAEADVALSIGTELRQVASQGYGILALQAATSGAGINELVGHVVAFSLLATTTTPWPLPPGCRVLLVNLDEYRHWFPGKRADLLAIALDTREGGVHVAAIEVKARRSDETDAASGALDQLNQTLAATRWAAYPEPNTVHSRLWLNRIAEAAYAVARESRFKLNRDELAALEAFRSGRGTLEWAGVGLVFGPKVEPIRKIYRNDLAGDIVPIVIRSVRLTEQLLRNATKVSLTDLRTVESGLPPLQGTRVRRRPESKRSEESSNSEAGRNEASGGSGGVASSVQTNEAQRDASTADGNLSRDGVEVAKVEQETADPARSNSSLAGEATEDHRRDVRVQSVVATAQFTAPVLGWDAVSGDEMRWHPAGAGQDLLQNGHVEVWGSSGMGKTQFVMALLTQLAQQSGTRFGVADFKNDYSDDTGFPAVSGAEFIDLWKDGAPYNPLALDDRGDRAVAAAVIELRDTVEEATRAFTRMGIRQKAKLEAALLSAYSIGKAEERWPTLRTLDDELDQDLAGVMGDLTRHDLFRSGQPLGEVINRNVVFGLSKIPGNGQTTVLAAGFILSALLLRVQNLPPIPNSVRYVIVVDEAHRVAAFQAIRTMIREGRSKGLGVIMATQQPLDLPDVVATNAQTKICFGLPDASVATMAARKLEPGNPRLAEQIRTLAVGEAFVSLRGEPPRLLRMVQAYRDRKDLGVGT